MVPLIWAFFSADVNAGTASAARIAIIAITTNNSIRVNAEEVLFVLFIFIGVCSEWGGLSHCSQIKSMFIFDLFLRSISWLLLRKWRSKVLKNFFRDYRAP